MRVLLLGALGEVGTSLSRALLTRGHEVTAVSSRAPIPDRPEAVGLDAAVRLFSGGAFDVLVNASGRGDRRPSDRSGLSSAEALGSVLSSAAVPTILISTTRVLEGRSGVLYEGDSAAPTTPYGRANASGEAAWLEAGGHSVLRLSNFFAAPSAADSPQSLLLPWSLATEAVRTGRIEVRSSADVAREFVSGDDVAAAIELIAASEDPPRACWTAPGVRLSLAELVDAVALAAASVGLERPTCTFGQEASVQPDLAPGWLAERGWASGLDQTVVVDVIARWLRDQGLSSAS